MANLSLQRYKHYVSEDVPAVDIAPMPEDTMTKVHALLLPDLVCTLIILFLLNAGHVSLS